MADADAGGSYIKVHLARPVAKEGQARLIILKTYKDAKSYYRDGNTIVFNRSLGIKRNSVVLPAGFERVGGNGGAQIFTHGGGRQEVVLPNSYAGEAMYIDRASNSAT